LLKEPEASPVVPAPNPAEPRLDEPAAPRPVDPELNPAPPNLDP